MHEKSENIRQSMLKAQKERVDAQVLAEVRLARTQVYAYVCVFEVARFSCIHLKLTGLPLNPSTHVFTNTYMTVLYTVPRGGPSNPTAATCRCSSRPKERVVMVIALRAEIGSWTGISGSKQR